MIIRESTPADAEQMISHVQRLAEEPDVDTLIGPGEFNLTVEEERQILAEYAAADNAVFLVAEADGQIVGVLNCRGGKRRAVRHAVSLGISVAREWRGRGVGKALMARVVEWAKGTGIVKRIELNTFARNQRAIHLYEQFGFQVEGRRRRAVRKSGEYQDELVMALLL